ncbi:DUF4241 domain-containing protein [Actinoallomurus spadix]|uniref:DUF4241 domain-containing protein n=1 Tax=Actinoallomurus spadix TaxID=79912 RepID=A0ABP3FK19_9ACTN|nr:DUF4241 domain-containing protein [Actinoallomurus spadix]MCO5987504.1 DUF4241 domain-containing protein [Actinoallomurus spadix]
MAVLQPRDYDRFFVAGTVFHDGGRHCTIQLDRGRLSLSSGRVAASEPGFPIEAFTQTVSPGRYPVVLAVVEFRDTADGDVVDERVAAARVVIRDEPVASWELALWPGRDATDLVGEDRYYGYPVDGGLASFADADAVQALQEEPDFEWWEELRLDVSDRPTSPTEAEGPDGEPVLVAFTSGFGDGIYPTWVGRTPDGEVACFVTDFFVVPEEEVG